MRTFYEFMESIYDPKRNPSPTYYEKPGNDLEPGDDGYKEPDPFFDNDDEQPRTNSLGLTAQYPLAKAGGNMRGFQVKTPKQAMSSRDDVAGLRGPEVLDTLRSKLRTGEKMTGREIDLLLKLLNKQDEKLRR